MPIKEVSKKLHTLKKYVITILLMSAICSPAFARESHKQSDSVASEIKKSVIAIGQTSKEAGIIIGQNFMKFGKKTGQFFKDFSRTLRDRAEKDLK